jgi:DNA-binding MarR family transcriptional regulator
VAATPPPTTSASTDDDLAAFEAAWSAFFAAIRRARARSVREQPGGVSLSQLNLVRPLVDGGAHPVGELAELAGVSAPTASRMLDCLEREGLVERSHAMHDRRVVAVSLTGEGERVLADKVDAVRARQRELFGELSADERRQGAALLARLAGILDRL